MRGRESKALSKRAEKRKNLRKRGALRPQKRDVRAVGAFIKIDADKGCLFFYTYYYLSSG